MTTNHKQAHNDNKGGGFALGALIGAIGGAIAGVLFAPKSGEETREDLKRKAEEAKRMADTKLQEVKDKASGLRDEVQERGSDLADKAKDVGQKVKEALEADTELESKIKGREAVIKAKELRDDVKKAVKR